jgi:small conductance mechanosensitive channel
LSTETIKLLLFLFAGLCVCVLVHWLAGLLERRIARRWSKEENSESVEPAIAELMAEWSVHGLRVFVWVLFFVYVIYLLPQTRLKFYSVSDRLLDAREHLFTWLFGRGITVVIILVVTIFLARFTGDLIRTGFELAERRTAHKGRRRAVRRLETLSDIFSRVAQAVIIFVGLLELLPHLNLNVTPILASAGVVGIAIGFGAQSLIKDLFSGLLILLEDQYSVGDLVKVGETTGKVEHLTLRATHVRNLDGAMTIIPNGAITTVSNLSKGWSRVVLDMEIDYDEDMDRAMQVMLEVAGTLRTERPQDVTDDPVMLGVDRMTNTSVVLRMLVKTAPARHNEIGRELRRLIKIAFDREGIRVPPSEHRVVLSREKARDD